MNYHCPKCTRTLKVRNLFFHDITACPDCGQKVVLGDFFAFAFAAVTMLVAALSTLYILSHEFEEYFVAAGYALTIGMVAGLAVMLLLGRATPFKRLRIRPTEHAHGGQPPAKA